MNQFDILVAGEICVDLILSGEVEPAFGQVEKIVKDAVLTIGSSSAIFACGAARLGLRVGFIGVCGDDLFGRFMLAEMQNRQVDVTNVIIRPGMATGISVILDRGYDRAILTHLGQIPALKADDLPDELLNQARHLHVGSYFLQTGMHRGLLSLFQHALSLGLTTSLDPNYDPTESWCGIDELLPVTTVFLPNEREAIALTNAEDEKTAAARLSSKGNIVVVKRGAEGAIAAKGDQIFTSATLAVNVKDTVGAGDSFDAGFLYGFLQGWSLVESLKMGTICGALSTRQAGGTTGQATLTEAMQELSGD